MKEIEIMGKKISFLNLQKKEVFNYLETMESGKEFSISDSVYLLYPAFLDKDSICRKIKKKGRKEQSVFCKNDSLAWRIKR